MSEASWRHPPEQALGHMRRAAACMLCDPGLYNQQVGSVQAVSTLRHHPTGLSIPDPNAHLYAICSTSTHAPARRRGPMCRVHDIRVGCRKLHPGVLFGIGPERRSWNHWDRKHLKMAPAQRCAPTQGPRSPHLPPSAAPPVCHPAQPAPKRRPGLRAALLSAMHERRPGSE